MKILTWSLRRPTTDAFKEYKQLPSSEPWYSKKYVNGTGKAYDSNNKLVKTFDPSTAPEVSPNWSDGNRGFIRQIEQNYENIHSIGMHEFYVCADGTIVNMGYPQVMTSSGYYGYDETQKVLNIIGTDIARPVPTSLRYLMHNYPSIKWSIQVLCTSDLTGDRVLPLLTNKTSQDTFIKQLKKIVELYKKYGFPITEVEVDFEKTTSPEGSWNQFKDLLVRVKNEVCILTDTKLRVNLFAMTGSFTPDYYAWHDYGTIASGLDINGRQAVDEFQLMTYDFSWGGSAPGPSTPLDWLKSVLEHVKNVLPPEKTWIGNAGYGRRWPLYNTRMGVTFDYKQLMDAQNGSYIHNEGVTSGDGYFHFNDQDFIPFAGFNDSNSDYSITYLHTYDMFKSKFGTISGNITRVANTNYVTAYSGIQSVKITGEKARLNVPSSISGNSSSVQGNLDGTVYNFATNEPKKYFYDTTLKACVLESGSRGSDGSVNYRFDLPTAGSYKVIAIVSFPFFGSDNFNISINGTTHSIGKDIPEWYPYITNPSYHYWDCGTYSLATSNEISVGLTNGASIGGFIICDAFTSEITGGKISFNPNLQKMKKRGNASNGVSSIVDAQYPSKMILTGEILRRPPRPAIIWEDMFGPHLNGTGFNESTDLTLFAYYQRANSRAYSSGSGTTHYIDGSTNQCISGLKSVGFSKGVWTVKGETSEDYAYARADLRDSYGQIVLNKRFSGNMHIELDCSVDREDTNPRYGIRLMSTPGVTDTGWIFRLNFQTNQVEFYDLSTPSNSRYADMSDALKNGKGNRYTLKLQRIGSRVICTVNQRTYLDILVDFPEPIAYGAYGVSCRMKVYRLNISSLDRYEPMEKVNVHIDNSIYTFGQVARSVGYDEFGYLVYTGLPGSLTEAVNAIPSDPDGSGSGSEVIGRSGTIFETETTPEKWSLDYKNMQLATVPSWIGKKNVYIELKDSGIWFRTFYIGDEKGYSVAYNSDKIAFNRTSKLVSDYSCKGIALWTLGQEDPEVLKT